MALRVRSETAVPERVAPDDFQENLTQMVRLTRDAGSLSMLLTAPTSHVRGQEPQQLEKRHLRDLGRLVPLHQQYVEIVREVAHKERVALCDLAAEFDRILQADRINRYFDTDGIHPSDAGHEKIAELLLACFDSQEELQKAHWWPVDNAREPAFDP